MTPVTPTLLTRWTAAARSRRPVAPDVTLLLVGEVDRLRLLLDRVMSLTRLRRLIAAGDDLAALVERVARVANLPEERAAVAAWRAAKGED